MEEPDETPQDPPPTVYVVDDQMDLCNSLARLLESEGYTVACFVSAAAFLKICHRYMRGCALLDLRLPDISGLELQARMMKLGVELPVIFLTGYGDVATSSQAFRSGALDFLEKPIQSEQLLERIREAFDRDRDRLARRAQRAALEKRYAKLTEREKDVMRLVVMGLTSKQVAKELGISNRTVEVHRAHLMEKMQAGSLPELVVMGMELGDRL